MLLSLFISHRFMFGHMKEKKKEIKIQFECFFFLLIAFFFSLLPQTYSHEYIKRVCKIKKNEYRIEERKTNSMCVCVFESIESKKK
jgi:hypothetical protein